MKLKVFTAFSGYDSQCLALERLKREHPDFDYELVGWSEIDPNAIKAHDILFPEAKDRNKGDISKIDWSEVDDFDLFTYSSPCQSFSLAGSLGGGEEGSGTQSSLLWECRRCIAEKRPKYLILENVPNLVSKRFIGLFNKWIDTVASFGYKSYWTTLNAKDFGVPQNRERVFLVSLKNDCIDAKRPFMFPSPLKKDISISSVLEKDVKGYDIGYKKTVAWVTVNSQKIVEHIAERNNVEVSDIALTNQEIINIIYTTDNKTEQVMSRKNKDEEKNVSTDDIIDNELANEELTQFDESFKPTQMTEEEKSRPKKPIVEFLSEEDKKIRGNDKCIKIIPTPTRSDNAAPTIMATGYASADYKNFYSVGHFPKLGIFEVWRRVPKKTRKKKAGTAADENETETPNTNALI